MLGWQSLRPPLGAYVGTDTVNLTYAHLYNNQARAMGRNDACIITQLQHKGACTITNTRAKHKRDQPQPQNADTPDKQRAGAAQLCGRAWTQTRGPLRATTLGVGGRRRGQDVEKESLPVFECCRCGSWARKPKAPRAHASWKQSSDGGLIRDSRACAWRRTEYTWATIQTGAQLSEGQRASWESPNPFRPPGNTPMAFCHLSQRQRRRGGHRAADCA